MLIRNRVLIVDDEHALADTLANIFSDYGYAVRAVYSAEEALQVFPEWLPGLVISDVSLPKMNGPDMGTLLMSQYPDCRILFCSGDLDTSAQLAQAERRGDVLKIHAKPVPPKELLDMADRLLRSA